MASIASPSTHHFYPNKFRYSTSKSSFFPFIVSCMDQQPQQDENTKQVGRRDIILRSSEIAALGALFNFRNYNPEGKRGNISREKAMAELLQVVKSTKPDKSSPKIVEKTADYVRVEYESPILGLVDDVEFWFPPGKKTIVQYRAASRLGNYDFDANRKRIKALRMQLEKKGWASEDTV
ncbi:uncharacterized protein LOC107873179 isoform X2 [Capsicum annuum]|uniref:uncharacterized protein LOC107873179 isoform X2 n=1 Tax=Capsicum annuum TaxID=4072 RepID=UPI001FB1456F|nr:uncharacterized protein LOC107873179 isoform X2 [Capsicum annuum]